MADLYPTETPHETPEHEQWRIIPDWPRYSVSDQGRVARTHDRIGRLMPICRILKPAQHGPTGGAYFAVVLSDNGRLAQPKIHHLVLEAFIGARPEGMECRHLNGNRFDNRAINLAWGTRRENAADRKLHGTFCPPPVSQPRKLSRDSVRRLREDYANGVTNCRILANQYGVSRSLALQIVKGLSRVNG